MASAPPASIPARAIAEHAHYRLKDAIDQALSCGAAAISTPPTTTPASSGRWWRDAIVWWRGSWSRSCLAWDPCRQPPVPEYANYQSKVRKWCTIQVARHSYSVPSRLIGKEVQIRLYADWVEVLQGPPGGTDGAGAWRGGPTSITATSLGRWCASPAPLPATASGSSCFPPCTSG